MAIFLRKVDEVEIIPFLCDDAMFFSLVYFIGLQPGQGGGATALCYLPLYVRHTGCGGHLGGSWWPVGSLMLALWVILVCCLFKGTLN